MDKMYRCPCCGYMTLDEPNGSYGICPVCFWEDEPIIDPDKPSGANRISLNEARENFNSFGACEKRFIKNVRPPKDSEKV